MIVKIYNTEESRYLNKSEILECIRNENIKGFFCINTFDNLELSDLSNKEYPRYIVQLKLRENYNAYNGTKTKHIGGIYYEQ